ncbi:MAG TPA: glycerophosphodiester phosphodiesterase [Actinomycetes bacterium]|nr:glycerophosphodiester phosphodiesterase [Actinomycetes bacterium]
MSAMTPGPAGRARPLVIAHRGASERIPEHTLAAYTRAIEDGADGLEADVRLTADGHLVCVHDRTINRTSNGAGVLSTLELADLQSLDFGGWQPGSDTAELPDQVSADRSEVLTLERLLELVVDSPRLVQLMVETKHPTRYAGLVERTLVELLRRFGLDGWVPTEEARVTVMSFSELALRRVRRLTPGVPLVLLMERIPVSYRSGMLPKGVRVSGPSIDVVRMHPRYVKRVHNAGSRVFVWTVDDADDVAMLCDLGVDAIITNRPHDVIAEVDRITGGTAAERTGD